jgi:hypothetical protein
LKRWVVIFRTANFSVVINNNYGYSDVYVEDLLKGVMVSRRSVPAVVAGVCIPVAGHGELDNSGRPKKKYRVQL